MANDDVICLSSDDESTPVQTTREKFKETAGPVKSELEPSARRSVNFKRTGSSINESKLSEIKKPKVSSQVPGQEIADSLPLGLTNEVSKLTSNAKKVNLTLPRYVRKSTVHEVKFLPRNNGSWQQKTTPEAAQSKATGSRSTDHSATLSNKIKAGNPESRHSLTKQLSHSSAHPNSTKKNESLPSNGLKTLDDKKKTEKTVTKPPEKTMRLGERMKSPVMDGIREEMSDLPNIRITPLGNSSKVSVAKHQEKTTLETAKLSERNRCLSSDQNPRGQSTNNTTKIARTQTESLRELANELGRLLEQRSPKVSVDRKIAQASSSPEIIIVEAQESSKIQSIASDSKVNGKSEKLSNFSLRRPTSKEDNSVSKDSEHVSSSRKHPSGTAHKLDNPGGEGSKCNENFGKESSQCALISRTSRTSLESEKIDVSKKPTRITRLQLNKPNANESNSKKRDVRNGRLSTSSESENEKISKKPFEPVAGCSKTPDVVIWAEPKKKKLKASPDPSFMTTPWQEQEHDEVGGKPEPLGLHKSSPKPHLVVKTKEPASVEQDTFAMFLSMCLQAERSPEMEKIVAKLKRNYDQLDPVYSRSQMFSDFLNDIRDRISAKGRIYSYISRVADEMKFRRKKAGASATKDKKGETNVPGTKGTGERVESSTEVNDEQENSHESRRLRQKIKTIEMAMKKCAKRIQQYEVAEVDLDADDNSNYIKMERYKSKMVELYTKLCEFTNEHPDAGRSYLRPKHLRVTQIPSIDQAINSFINSKLSYNRKKTNKSFLDGLIFPDYVDILECVAKVNEEQELGLDKWRQQQLAKEAFTELGKKLQEARQRDYWDTFSENLENSDDPAAADPTLAEKLLENKKIAEKNTTEIFEEYVRKQEQRNETDHESTNSESGHEEDDEQDEEKTDRDGSDVELSDIEDPASSSENEKEKNPLKISEPLAEAEREHESPEEDNSNVDSEIEEDATLATANKTVESSEKMPNRTEETLVNDKPMKIAVNRIEDGCEEVIEILESVPEVERPQEKTDEDSVGERGTAQKKQKDESHGPETKTDKASAEKNGAIRTFSDKAKDSSTEANGSVGIEAAEVEVNHAETDTEEETIEPVIEQPKVLRIRSFAKPPSSWASSQQSNQEEPDLESSINAETIDLLDDEPENRASKVPTSLKTLPEARASATTTVNPGSQGKKKLVVEVSRKLGETTLSVKTKRSTIVIQSANKSSPNQLSRIAKKNPNQELSVQKKMAIVRNLQSLIGQSESFKNRLTQDPSVPMDKAIAPISKTNPRNGQFTQKRPQQSSVQKHIAVATSSNVSPGKSRSEQTRPQQSCTWQKQIPVARNRPQQSSFVQKQPATAQQTPRKSQSSQNLQKPITTSRSPTTSHANSQSSQNRVHQIPPLSKLVETSKEGAGTSHRKSSIPSTSTMSHTSKLFAANSQILENCLAQSVALQKLLSLAGTLKAGAGNVKTSLNVSHQTTTTAATITQKVRPQNTVASVLSQDQLINLANRLVFPLDSPQSIKIKSPTQVQNFSAEQLKAVKLVINNNEISVNNNNKNVEKARAMTKKLSSAKTAQNSSKLRAVSLATAKNPIRPGSLPAQRNPQAKPSNSQPLVKLRAPPNPQILHSVQQQLMNVSKATIRPLGVPSIQAQGITLKNPRIIRLPGQATSPAGAGAARTVAHPASQNRFQRPLQSANSTNSSRTVQGVNWRPTIHRTNYVLKPHTSNNTPPNPQHQQNFKRAAPKFSRPPYNNAPPNK